MTINNQKAEGLKEAIKQMNILLSGTTDENIIRMGKTLISHATRHADTVEVLRGVRDALKSVTDWHRAISDYQGPLLATGNLQEACNSWDAATDVQVLDVEPCMKSLNELNKLIEGV